MSTQFIYCATHLNILLTTYVMSTPARIRGLYQRKGYFDVC